MDYRELATILDGREIGNEISKQEAKQAKADGLVVVFGASDDLMEFRGAIYDEAGAYDGGEVHIVDGKLWTGPDCDHHGEGCRHAKAAEAEALARGWSIKALWCEEKPYSWTYKTDIPHATFDVLEDGEKYCRGIVFQLA